MNKRLSISFLSLVLGAAGVQASTVAQAVKDCSQEQNSLKRLVCYDKISKALNQYQDAALPGAASVVVSGQTAEPAPSDAPVGGAMRTQDPADYFGMEHKQKASAEELDKILITVSKVDKDPYDKLILTLGNGQQWKQIDSQRYYLPDGQLYIERGVLGSFFLGSEDSKRRMRVTRIK